MMDEEMEMLYGALAHPENENGGFGFSVPRMRNQQIFEAKKFAFYASIFQWLKPKLASNLRPFLASKNRVGLYGFQACSGTFFVSVPMEPTGN